MATYSALGNRKKNLAATPAPDTHAEQQAGCDLMSRDSGCCKISINLLQNATRSSRSPISYVPSRNIVRVLSLGCNWLSSMKAINSFTLYVHKKQFTDRKTFDHTLFDIWQPSVLHTATWCKGVYAIFIHILVVSWNMIHFKMFNYGLSVYPHFSYWCRFFCMLYIFPTGDFYIKAWDVTHRVAFDMRN